MGTSAIAGATSATLAPTATTPKGGPVSQDLAKAPLPGGPVQQHSNNGRRAHGHPEFNGHDFGRRGHDGSAGAKSDHGHKGGNTSKGDIVAVKGGAAPNLKGIEGGAAPSLDSGAIAGAKGGDALAVKSHNLPDMPTQKGGTSTPPDQTPPAGTKDAVAGANGGPTGGAVGGAAGGLEGILASLNDIITQLQALIAQLGGTSSTPKGGPAQDAGGCGMAGCSGDMHAAIDEQVTPAVAGMWGTMAGEESKDTVAPTAARSVATTSGSEDGEFERQVISIINGIRAQYGLSALAYDGRLDTAAEGHNAVMIDQKTMAHKDLGDGLPSDRVRAAGYDGAWGENVAVGQKTPQQVVDEWMASPTHQANILNPNFHLAGISYGTTSTGVAFWTNTFGA
jgi:uncharacterized protein YkwD